MKTRNIRGEFAKKPSIISRVIRWVLFLGIIGFLIIKGNTLFPSDSAIPIQKEYSELEQMMNRDDIKRQHELLAKETLLKEKKAKLQADFDSQMQAIETELEAVRKERVGF
jgi:hypothetical protein